MEVDNDKRKPSIAFKTLLLLTSLTAVGWTPHAISAMRNPALNETAMVFVVLYPIYSLLSVYLAYRCYADRREISWILIVLVWLSLFAEMVLVDC